jgi:hypothetical protein
VGEGQVITTGLPALGELAWRQGSAKKQLVVAVIMRPGKALSGAGACRSVVPLAADHSLPVAQYVSAVLITFIWL